MAPNKVRIKTMLFVLVVTMLVLTPILLVCCDKPNIHDATREELQEIMGIGDILSERIVTHLDYNKTVCIEDLACIDGIGEKAIIKLKRKFGD